MADLSESATQQATLRRLSRREFGGLSVGALALLAAGCGAERSESLVGNATPTVPVATLPTTTVPDGPLIQRFATQTSRSTDPQADGVAVNAAVAGLNQFGIDAYQQAAKSAGATNVILGNYSLATALSLTLAGMAGTSRQELAEMLHLENIDPALLDPALNALDLIIESRATEELDILTANKLFVKPGLPLVPEYLDTAVEHYGAPVTEAEFGSGEVAAEVNAWVAEQTDGFIEDLVDTYQPSTVMAIVNAVYLKAPWGVTFTDKGNGNFKKLGGEARPTPFFGHDDFLPINIGDTYQAVEMPYAGGNLAMLAIMPNNLERFESSLTAERLDEIVGGLNESGIHFALPKWAAEEKYDGRSLLDPLGLPAGDADFSGMIEGGQTGFSIGAVDHLARIEVDETGTTAAAATSVEIAGSHGPTITFNRPFLYVIRDRGSGAILFIGRVADPLNQES